MRRFLMLSLLGCTFLAAPALAGPSAKAAPLNLDPETMSRPILASFPFNQEPICTESCNTTYDSITFVRQKDNGVCVYQCSYHTTCTDSCFPLSPTTTYGGLRVRSDPLPPNTCPTAALTFCDGFAID